MAFVVSRHPEIMSGAPVFDGTRVPIRALIDSLEAGESIDEFLDGFPSVARTQVVALLEDIGTATPPNSIDQIGRGR